MAFHPTFLSTKTGLTQRIGKHPCFDRYVFEMEDPGDVPGYSVGYRSPIRTQGQGAAVSLRGSADLEILVGVWTVPPGVEGYAPFTGPTDITDTDFEAIQQVRLFYAFEGQTQIAIGVDKKRPFTVTFLGNPSRLVVDIYTGP